MRLGLTVGLRLLVLGTLGRGEKSGRGVCACSSHHLLFAACVPGPSGWPRGDGEAAPFFCGTPKHRECVPWAGMGCVGFPSARRQCCSPQSCGCCGDSAQLSPLGACVLQPVSPWSQWGQHPWLCRTRGKGIRWSRDHVGDTGELWGCRHVSCDRWVSPLCLLLRSQALLTASCLLFWCHNAALARDVVSPHVQVTARAEKGVDGWCGTSLTVLLTQGRKGICWGMLVPTMEVLGPSGCAKCHCHAEKVHPGRWEASPCPSW